MNFGKALRAVGMTVAKHPILTGGAILVADRVLTTAPCRPGLLRGIVEVTGVGLVAGGALIAGARATGALGEGAAGVLRGNPSALMRVNPFAGFDSFESCLRSKSHTQGIRDPRAYCGAIERNVRAARAR